MPPFRTKPRLVVALLCVALLVGLGAALTARFLAEPTVTRNFAEELNRTLGAGPEESALPLIHRAIPAMAGCPTFTDDRGQAVLVTGDERRGERGSQVLAQWLDTQAARDALDLWRRAADRPKLGALLSDAIDPELAAAFELAGRGTGPDAAGASENPATIGLLLPYLGEFRAAARLLAADARSASERGDGALAIANMEAIFGLSRLTAQQPTLISSLVAIALREVGTALMLEILAGTPPIVDPDGLDRLALVLSAASDDISPEIALDGELAMALDMIQRTYSDNGRGGGFMTTSGAAMLAQGFYGDATSTSPTFTARLRAFPAALAAPGRSALTERAERRVQDALALARTPLHGFDASPEHRALLQPLGSPLTDPLAPAFERCAVSFRMSELRLQAARTIIALHQHSARTGAWPVSLDALVPSLLPVLPIDEFDGMPLRYRAEGEGFTLWSVGTDRVDNLGVRGLRAWVWLPEAELAASRDAQLLGDLVLWPPLAPDAESK